MYSGVMPRDFSVINSCAVGLPSPIAPMDFAYSGVTPNDFSATKVFRSLLRSKGYPAARIASTYAMPLGWFVPLAACGSAWPGDTSRFTSTSGEIEGATCTCAAGAAIDTGVLPLIVALGLAAGAGATGASTCALSASMRDV